MKGILSILACTITFSGAAQNYYLFIGTYTSGKSQGIYVYNFNENTAKSNPVSIAKSENPSYLAIADGGNYLYAVNENGAGQQGDVSAFSFDKKTGRLHFINKQPSGGEDPCFISVNNSRSWAIVANYTGGNLSALPIKKDGSIGPATELIQHYGKSVNVQRQEKSHVHSAFLTPDERYVFSADLGEDKIYIYRFYPQSIKPLSDAFDSSVIIQAGSGPRHIAFHPVKPDMYLIEELSGTIDAFHYRKGSLLHFQRISSVPANFTGDPGSADIHISPDGKFLYASNRGDANTIAIYSIDAITGLLHLKGFQPVLGRYPRNFIIVPSGKFLLVANRDTDNIVIFRINRQTGMLAPTGMQIHVPDPVCLKLLKK
ncbi:MAG TPA: lactonase family protein [Chitinophagaceae bacterium]|nr:lactonase family protein [Chitinophagaceae bacterium]